jgi:hypothetical protein
LRIQLRLTRAACFLMHCDHDDNHHRHHHHHHKQQRSSALKYSTGITVGRLTKLFPAPFQRHWLSSITPPSPPSSFPSSPLPSFSPHLEQVPVCSRCFRLRRIQLGSRTSLPHLQNHFSFPLSHLIQVLRVVVRVLPDSAGVWQSMMIKPTQRLLK